MGLQILIPRSATEPRSRCLLCGTDFAPEKFREFARHVRECAKRNHDGFEAMEADRESSVFTSPEDPELYDHLRAGGN